MLKFNPQEHKTIVAGWRTLTDYAEIRGRMGETRELHAILTAARKELGDLTDAKGLLLSMFIEALDDERPNLAEIWQWPPYTREIKAYAWHTLKREGPKDEEWLAAVEAAEGARKARINSKRRASGLAPKEWMEITA